MLLTPHPDIARLLAQLPPNIDLDRVDLEEALGKDGAAKLRDDAWLNALQAQVCMPVLRDDGRWMKAGVERAAISLSLSLTRVAGCL